MLKRLIAATILAMALWTLGCDVMEQDVEVYPPGNPPGEEDEEDEAQTLNEE